MTKTKILLLVVILIITAVAVVPAFAESKACDNVWGNGHYYGWYVGGGFVNGKPPMLGPGWGYRASCLSK